MSRGCEPVRPSLFAATRSTIPRVYMYAMLTLKLAPICRSRYTLSPAFWRSERGSDNEQRRRATRQTRSASERRTMERPCNNQNDTTAAHAQFTSTRCSAFPSTRFLSFACALSLSDRVDIRVVLGQLLRRSVLLTGGVLPHLLTAIREEAPHDVRVCACYVRAVIQVRSCC